MRVSDRNDWFDLWYEDKKCICNTMVANMTADLAAGYDYFGNCIRKQVEAIEAYNAEVNRQLDEFKLMDDAAVNRWCFYDMKKRGAIG